MSPWYAKACSEECPGFTLNMKTEGSDSLDPTSPLFPFGFGLDYLNISYGSSTVQLSPDASTVSVTVEVISANGNSGSKVVQVYFSPPPSRVTRYKKMLAGFTKVAVPAHGSTQAVVEFKTTVLGHWDPRLSKHVVDPGKYLAGVCHDSTSARCVTSALVVPVPRAGQ